MDVDLGQNYARSVSPNIIPLNRPRKDKEDKKTEDVNEEVLPL